MSNTVEVLITNIDAADHQEELFDALLVLLQGRNQDWAWTEHDRPSPDQRLWSATVPNPANQESAEVVVAREVGYAGRICDHQIKGDLLSTHKKIQDDQIHVPAVGGPNRWHRFPEVGMWAPEP